GGGAAGDGGGGGAGPATGSGGSPAPGVTFEAFDGGQVTLADFHGPEPLVVNFWASWCPPCVAEMPDIERVHQDLGGEVAFLGINTQDTEEAADRLVGETGVTYPLVRDPDGQVASAFGVFGMPSTFFVTADGQVAHQHTGSMTEEQLRALIDEHLRS
ncbi:MAG: TlpA family protein disulfide reductase, partial [Nitriliruptorales bacterium]